MNPYVVSVSGSWPEEQYVLSIDPSVLDYRIGRMPINFWCSPYYSEDHDFTQLSYTPPSINSLVGLSSNSNFEVTQNDLEFNVKVIPNLTFSWSPSALRKSNKGNVFGALALNDSSHTYYGAMVYPSQLFLLPLGSSVINSYQILTSNDTVLSAYNLQNLNDLLNEVNVLSSLNFVQVSKKTPPVSSVWYSITSLYTSSTYLPTELDNILAIGLTQNWLFSSYSVLGGITSVNYSLSSPYISSDRYFSTIEVDNFYTSLGADVYQTYLLVEQLSTVSYNTLVYQLTGQTYTLQTSTVLLDKQEFQFKDWNYTQQIKQNHSNFLSQGLSISALNFRSDISLDNVMYELSGAVTLGYDRIYDFLGDLNPIYIEKILTPQGYVIRPDTTRLSYDIEFYDFISKSIPFVRGMGDITDDVQLYPDRKLGASYILKHDEINKTLTFQLLQSSVNPHLPLEDTANCVLSAILNLDTSKFEYFNTGKYVYTTDTYGVITPVSGVRGSSLALRYMAESPYILNTSENINSTLLSISSYPNVSLNTPVNWANHNRTVNWELKYPPYYYSFKNSYKKSPYYNYENKNSLNFYLSTTFVDTRIVSITSTNEKYAEVNLYTSVYSDFDILVLPLKDYGQYDFINYRIENANDEMLEIDRLSAFLVTDDGTIFYDLTSSPFVPAASGAKLRILYDMDGGGTIFTIRPSLSTLCGLIEAFWATTFSVALDYDTVNFLKPIQIETIAQDLSSITLSVSSLSGGEDDADLELSRTNLVWSCSTNDAIIIENLTPNIPDLPIIQQNIPYIFEDANIIKITGLTDQTLVVGVSSERYNTFSTVERDLDFFDLYAENIILISETYSSKKNKIKEYEFLAQIPYFNKKINLLSSCAISWTWNYDGIPDFNQIPVSAYTDSSFTNSYKYGNVVYGLDKIYFLIDTNYTTTEIFKSFQLNIKVIDAGKEIKGELITQVNSYPDPSVFSTDFIVAYDKFSDVKLLDTSNGIKSLTRPPNNTNTFIFTPQKLQTSNVVISSLQWVIDSYIVNDIDTVSQPISTVVIPVSTNEIGDYETSLTKSFNLYNRTYKDYYNLEYLNGNSASQIVKASDLDSLLNLLTEESLSLKNSYLVYLSGEVSLQPTVTSLYVVSTTKYTSSFDISNDFSFLQKYDNLYSSFSYTSTISVLSGTALLYTYKNYVIDFWLSSSKIEISDDYSIISSFSSLNINNNSNLLFYTTEFNLTTSLSYGISADNVRTDLYYYNTIHLKAENVSIPGWQNLYDVEKSTDVIITNRVEFTTVPLINIIPKFSWVPAQNQKSNRYLRVLNIDDGLASVYDALSGKVYANRRDKLQEYDLQINGIQDRGILPGDPLTFIFSLGENLPVLLEDQIIDTENEYIIDDPSLAEVRIKNLKLPYHPELYTSTGANIYVTAFNKYFPPEGGITYLSMDSLTSTELVTRVYPITAATRPREYNPDGSIVGGNLFNMSPRLYEYEPCRLLFYPKLNIVNLDDSGLIQVKQILETNPPNSPNIINFDLSTVTYTLSSDYWVSSLTLPAASSATLNLFNITVGDAFKPLQVSNYNISNLILSASARVATQILPSTFSKVSGYSGNTNLWEIVYEDVIGNTENVYKFLNYEISNGSTNTTYYPIETENKWILVI